MAVIKTIKKGSGVIRIHDDYCKDNTPEDGHDHMVNSVQYAWIPYQSKIYRG